MIIRVFSVIIWIEQEKELKRESETGKRIFNSLFKQYLNLSKLLVVSKMFHFIKIALNELVSQIRKLDYCFVYVVIWQVLSLRFITVLGCTAGKIHDILNATECEKRYTGVRSGI